MEITSILYIFPYKLNAPSNENHTMKRMLKIMNKGLCHVPVFRDDICLFVVYLLD